MVRDVGLEDKDVIVFHVVDAQKLKFTHFKVDCLSGVKNKFFFVEMLFPENDNLVIYTLLLRMKNQLTFLLTIAFILYLVVAERVYEQVFQNRHFGR